MMLSAELMLHGVSLTLVTFGRMHHNLEGQAFTIFILTVAACEAGLALSLILALYQKSKSLDVEFWTELREPDLPSPRVGEAAASAAVRAAEADGIPAAHAGRRRCRIWAANTIAKLRRRCRQPDGGVRRWNRRMPSGSDQDGPYVTRIRWLEPIDDLRTTQKLVLWLIPLAPLAAAIVTARVRARRCCARRATGRAGSGWRCRSVCSYRAAVFDRAGRFRGARRHAGRRDRLSVDRRRRHRMSTSTCAPMR